jgi:hypothetical protein
MDAALKVTEKVFVLLFQCGECGRPIVQTHCSAAFSMAEIKDHPFPVRCAVCSWSANKVGNEAKELWEVPWSRPFKG